MSEGFLQNRTLARPVSKRWSEFCRYQKSKGNFPAIFACPSKAETAYLKIEKQWAVRNGIPNLELYGVFQPVDGKYLIPHRLPDDQVILIPDGLLRFNNLSIRDRAGQWYLRCVRSASCFERTELRVGRNKPDLARLLELIYQHHIEPSYPTKDYSMLFNCQRVEPVTDQAWDIFRRKGRSVEFLQELAPKTTGSFLSLKEVIELYREIENGA